MNKTLTDNNDANFKQACNLFDKNFSQEELFSMLKHGDILQKHFAALHVNDVSNDYKAQILVSNLTGCDGKIREAVALKINELILNDKITTNYFAKYPQDFAKATIDINANICRLVVCSVEKLTYFTEFKTKYYKIIFEYIEECFNELNKFIYKDKKYVINKQLFKLYWCLEAISLCAQDLESDKLLAILKRASIESEYTIREKVAQIIVKFDNTLYDELKKKLKEDSNYYVKSVFYK